MQFKLSAMTADKDEWFELATETTKKLKTAGADVALQSALREAAREEMDTHTTEIAELKAQLKPRGA